MTIRFVFWVLMLLWLVMSVLWAWPDASTPSYRPVGGILLIFVLFTLLGWKVFGPPVQG